MTVEGVLLARTALDAGWPPSRLYRTLTGEGWTRVPAGTWVAPERELDLPMRLRAGQLAMPGLVASHRAAAVLWRIEVSREELEFTDPCGKRRRAGARTHWLRLPPEAPHSGAPGGPGHHPTPGPPQPRPL
ncbi:hypothetical protein ABZ916_30845 [Streptomyces sp. NPDC046853]|uniref:hypothetical protein n=1 Tax=Streptomyces sp. NPDC046853 TaxID=3154920 RepID=UPI0033F5CBA5